jgi:hypothetical protein
MSLRMANYEECNICFDKMKGNATLECGHQMCIACCLMHFDNKDTCPFCRHTINRRFTHINYQNNRTDTIPEQIGYTMNHSWPLLFLSHFEKNILFYGCVFGMFILLCVLFPNYKVTIEFSQKD